MFGVALAGSLVLPGQEVLAQQKAIAQVQINTPVYAGGRLTVSDAVIVGRVVGLEPADVEATPAPGQAKTNYRIAVVQLTETLHGVQKDSKMIRVGFVAQPANFDPQGGPGGIQIQIQPGGRIMRQPFQPFGGVQVQVGQEGLFQLVKHHKEGFYLLPNYNSFVSSENPNFQGEIQNAKHLCKVLQNTSGSLKANDAQERFLAAAVLITKYRTHPGVAAKLVPIDAEESKLILKALASGNWTQARTSASVPTAIELFNQLGITVNDGYKQPVPVRNVNEIGEAMQKWVSANESKYVIKKYVADPNAKAVPQPQPPVAFPAPGRVQLQPLPAPAVPQVLPVIPNKNR
jgi:hypothetical protein